MVEILLGHILGDYYFQTEVMARRKETNQSALLGHCIFYAFGYFLVIMLKLILDKVTLIDIYLYLLLILSHALIDFFKFKYGVKINKRYRFYIDQSLHFITMIILYIIFLNKGFHPMTQDSLKIFTLILLVLKPLNILVNQMIMMYSPGDDASTIRGAGAYIGMIERFLFIIFLLMHEFTGIAVVLSIKSFARYKKVAEEPAFAEYFAIGTFTSLLVTLISYYLVIFVM